MTSPTDRDRDRDRPRSPRSFLSSLPLSNGHHGTKRPHSPRPTPLPTGLPPPHPDTGPIPPATLAEIDSLKTKFKKQGHFDHLRKELLASFTSSASNQTFINTLQDITTSELERDEDLREKDRSKAAALIQGAAERTDVYAMVEREIERLIGGERGRIEEVLRGMREEAGGVKKEGETQVKSEGGKAANGVGVGIENGVKQEDVKEEVGDVEMKNSEARERSREGNRDSDIRIKKEKSEDGHNS